MWSAITSRLRRRGPTLESIGQDVRYALRGLRRNPAFTTIAIASLALGIGANSTIFGIIDAMLLRAPAHVRDVDRIQRLYFDMPNPSGGTELWAPQGYRTYAALRDRVHGLEGIGAIWEMQVSSGRGADARLLNAAAVTPSLLNMLGLRPALGRFFAADEERDEDKHVAVVSYGAWRSLYASDSAVLGRRIDVEGLPYTIIGVLPDGFTGFDDADLWLPLGIATRMLNPSILDPASSGYWLRIIVKRKAGVATAQVERDATSVYHDVYRSEPRDYEAVAKSKAVLGPLVEDRGPARGPEARVAMWVAAVSVLVLLVACANVANLLLLRGLTRARDTALRVSLGVTRSRLARHALIEGLLLAIAGTLCAMIVARWTGSALRASLLPDANSASVIDVHIIAYMAVVAILTGVLASVGPALVTSRHDLGRLVNATRSSAGPDRLRLQRILIGSQVALTMLLVVGAGLFIVSFRNVRAIDLGIDVDHMLYVHLPRTADDKLDHNSTAKTLATYQGMLDRVRRVPGVLHATLTAGEPFATGWAIGIQRRGVPEAVPGSPVPFARAVGADYFATMGTALRRGRYFTAADHSPAARVAIIDEATAHAYWPNEDPLDPCVYFGEHVCTQIVGVVSNTVLWQVTGEKGKVVYFPIESADRNVSMIEVRARDDPAPLIPIVRQAIVSQSPNMPWVDIRPLSRVYKTQLTSWRLGASMFTAFGLLALGLAAVGLYGLLSYMVAQRTHEIAVRKALGAPDAGVIRLVLRDALSLMIIGVVIGVAVALVATRLIVHLLYGISPRDPLVIALGAGVLFVTAMVACLAPARRATRVDPMIALREE